MQHHTNNTLLCKQTIKKGGCSEQPPYYYYILLAVKASRRQSRSLRIGVSPLPIPMGQPSPEVSLLPYQYGILTARFFTTRLALAFRLIASFSFANSRPQSPYDYIISRRVCANYRNFCNRKSSHHTDTVFCACSLNCQRTVSVRGISFWLVP